ncbi:MAG: L-histidine N(alpha)-methyltransferase [Actinomycetota bacterium]
MVAIVTLLTEADLAEEFVASFRSGRIDEKFFYWFPLSVRAWLALCSDGEYRNYVRSRSLIAGSAVEIAALSSKGPIEVLSLGSGQGDKDVILLEALRNGQNVSYVPVDASQSLLEMACAAGLRAGFPSRGVKADIGRPDHLKALLPDEGTPPRLVVLIGNTLGAFDPTMPVELAGLLRPEDHLIVDGELFAGEETLGGYDNPINRRFAWAPLHSVGIGDEDGEIVFEAATDVAAPGLHAVTKHFRASREVRAMMGGEEFRLSPGDRVQMSRSGKYSPGALGALLEGAGLDTRWRGTSDDGRFEMVMAAHV